MFAKRICKAALIFLAFLSQTASISWAAVAQKFRSDEWITECDAGRGIDAPDCSITVPFWQTQGDQKGSFALVIMLQTGNLGIVGQPFPVGAVLRVDKNPPIECQQTRYCIFPSVQALAVLKQLKVGSLILIDVFTARGAFSFSLTPKGYQAGIAQIRAWGYRTE
jgi:invasion protein IalB